MASRSVVVGSFPTQTEAGMAQGVLRAHGIESYFDNVHVGTLLGGYLGPAVGGVQLLVREEDVERAHEALAEGRPGTGEDWVDAVFGEGEDEEEGEPWTCRRCGTPVSADLTRCWSCGAAPDGSEDPDFPSVASPGEAVVEEEDVAVEGKETQPPGGAVDVLARTAWRLAIVGLICFPPILHLVSGFYLLRIVLDDRRLSPDGTRTALWAFAIDALALGAAIGLLRLTDFF